MKQLQMEIMAIRAALTATAGMTDNTELERLRADFNDCNAERARWKAAAGVDERKTELEMGELAHQLFLETIERCAEVALNCEITDERHAIKVRQQIAAAIRALKDEP